MLQSLFQTRHENQVPRVEMAISYFKIRYGDHCILLMIVEFCNEL